MFRRTLAVTTAVIALSGCSDVTSESAALREPGVLQLVGYDGARPQSLSGAPDANVAWTQPPADTSVITPPQVIVAPAVVQSGTPFDVTVHTIGSSGCWRADGQEVRVQGARVIELVPYDVHSGANFCTGVIVNLEHPSQLTLAEPGEWTLRVIGRRMHYLNLGSSVVVSAEKTIVVQ